MTSTGPPPGSPSSGRPALARESWWPSLLPALGAGLIVALLVAIPIHLLAGYTIPRSLSLGFNFGCGAVAFAFLRTMRPRLISHHHPPEWCDHEIGSLRIRNYETGGVLVDVKSPTLRHASLWEAELEAANLRGLDLREARLAWADLRRAVLEETSLEGADLRGAQLEDALLYGASLRGADLRAADLRAPSILNDPLHPRLPGPDLTGALYDGATQWPKGFNPLARGCVRVYSEAVPAEAPTGTGTEPSS